ncbi:uncharacterized protein [Montipora capricornis]|uniref:uncharacterized protein n=1 Tax=Montipora foliosa TaxID=591990 RepID=UPI0035F182CE
MNAQNPSTSLQIEGRQGMKGKWYSEREINEPPAKSDDASYDMEDGYRRQEADRSEPCSIQAIVRTGRIERWGSDGNLLKAHFCKESDKKLIVDFTGVDPKDPSSVFHLEACDDSNGNVLRYSLGSDNYYLRVYSGGKVMLRKLKDYPTKDKYFFHIEKVSLLVACPATVQSLASKEYLASDENGKAFMKPGVDTVRDRQSWFGFHGSYFDHTLNKSEAMVQF